MFFYVGDIFGKMSVHVEFSRFGLLDPFRTVSVSVESDGCSLCCESFDQFLDRNSTLYFFVGFLDLFGNGSQDYCHGIVTVLGGSNCSELEPVGCVGIWACTITVCVLLF